MTGSQTARAERIEAAAAEWAASLRRHRGGGFGAARRPPALPLSAADPRAVAALLGGRPTRFRQLFPPGPARDAALEALRAVRDAGRRIAEERGVPAIALAAAGMPLAWLRLTSRSPAEDDFDLALDAPLEVAALPVGEAAVVVVPPDVEPIAAELSATTGLLAGSDVVAALAGDPDARAALRVAPEPPDPDTVPADAELSVLDADAVQRRAVDDVVAGGSAVLTGPPGSGRTQAIANLVAVLAGRGQTVLLTGDKAAALDAVRARLAPVGLDALVDYALPDQVGRTADPEPDPTAAAWTPPRDRLRDVAAALHEVREPWRLSLYDVHTALLALRDTESRVRLRLPELAALFGDAVARARADVGEWARLGGATLTAVDTPWYGARVGSPADADAAYDVVRRLAATTYPTARARLERALAEVGLPPAPTAGDWRPALDLLAGVEDTERRLPAEVWDAPLPDLVAATAPRRDRRPPPRLGWRDRRRLRRVARRLWRAPGQADPELHQALVTALARRDAWRAVAATGRPRPAARLAAARAAYDALLADLDRLHAYLPERDLLRLPPAVLEKTLQTLADDTAALRRLPRLTTLAHGLEERGLRPLLLELTSRRIPASLAAAYFDSAWLSSMLAVIVAADPRCGGLRGDELRAAAAAFRRADVAHLVANADRVRRAAARAPEPPATALALDLVPALLPPRLLYDVVVVADPGRVPLARAVPALARAGRVLAVGDDRGLPPPDREPSLLAALLDVVPVHRLETVYGVDARLVAFPAARCLGRPVRTFPAAAPEAAATTLVVAPPGVGEVQKAVGLVLDAAVRRPAETLGVVTFSAAHAGRVRDALRAGLGGRPELADVFADARAERFFVKDVTSAQGDTRDTIVLAVGPLGELGPLGEDGGERALCVALTLARRRLLAVSSFRSADVDPARLRGLGGRGLREFLRYAETGELAPPRSAPDATPDRLAADIAGRLAAAGVPARPGAGGRLETVDVACPAPGSPTRFVLAVVTDGPAYADGTVRDRERLRVEQLERRGWAVHRLWSADWLADPDREVERIRAAYLRATGQG